MIMAMPPMDLLIRRPKLSYTKLAVLDPLIPARWFTSQPVSFERIDTIAILADNSDSGSDGILSRDSEQILNSSRWWYAFEGPKNL